MEIKEAIELTILAKGRFLDDLQKYEALHMGKEAMEKQLPQKIRLKYEITYLCPPDCGGKENDEYGYIPHCPCCDAELDDMPEDNFCRKCGQRLAWD